jgi:hypothetical protein
VGPSPFGSPSPSCPRMVPSRAVHTCSGDAAIALTRSWPDRFALYQQLSLTGEVLVVGSLLSAIEGTARNR